MEISGEAVILPAHDSDVCVVGLIDVEFFLEKFDSLFEFVDFVVEFIC